VKKRGPDIAGYVWRNGVWGIEPATGEGIFLLFVGEKARGTGIRVKYGYAHTQKRGASPNPWPPGRNHEPDCCYIRDERYLIGMQKVMSGID